MMERNEQEDLLKLATVVVNNLQYNDSCEFGSISNDCKRPFGNSCNIAGDMLEIIGWEMEGDDGEGPCYAHYQNVYVYNIYTEKLAPFIKSMWNDMLEAFNDRFI